MAELLREVKIQGTSMYPRLRPGDLAALSEAWEYGVGDIAVFSYGEEGLLAHRVVKADRNRLFCKGDNSFRLEMVGVGDVLGKVTAVRRGDRSYGVEELDGGDIGALCAMSLQVHYAALRANWDIGKIRSHALYREYERRYLASESGRAGELALDTLRALYGGRDFDGAALEEQADEVADVFWYHDIAEQLSDVLPLRGFDVYMRAKLKRSANQAAHLKRSALAQPVFDGISFPYAVIKGVVLARTAYPNESYRGSSDVDILVDRRNVGQMEELLRRHGFVQGRVDPSGSIGEYTREERLFYLMSTHQTAPFVKPTGDARMPFLFVDVNFDLTWGEYEGEAIDIDGFLSDRELFSYGSGGFCALPTEKALLQCCLHHYKEMNSLYLLCARNSISLRGFCDIYGLIVRGKPDMEKVARLSEEYGVLPYVYTVLFFTARVFADDSILRAFGSEGPACGELLEQFGLSREERKAWPVGFMERLFSQNRFALIRPLLSEKDMSKIQANQRFM